MAGINRGGSDRCPLRLSCAAICKPKAGPASVPLDCAREPHLRPVWSRLCFPISGQAPRADAGPESPQSCVLSGSCPPQSSGSIQVVSRPLLRPSLPLRQPCLLEAGQHPSSTSARPLLFSRFPPQGLCRYSSCGRRHPHPACFLASPLITQVTAAGGAPGPAGTSAPGSRAFCA